MRKWGGGGGGEGRENLSSVSVQWKQVYATLPHLTTSTPPFPPPPPPPPASTIFLLFHFFLVASLNYNDSLYHTLLIGGHNRFT